MLKARKLDDPAARIDWGEFPECPLGHGASAVRFWAPPRLHYLVAMLSVHWRARGSVFGRYGRVIQALRSHEVDVQIGEDRPGGGSPLEVTGTFTEDGRVGILDAVRVLLEAASVVTDPPRSSSTGTSSWSSPPRNS